MIKFARSIIMVFMLGLLLAAPALGDVVEYTDSGLSISGTPLGGLINPPASPYFTNTLNSVWNNNLAAPGNNLVSVNYTSNTDPTYVLGGFNDSTQDVSNNTVDMINGTAGEIYGGFSVSRTAASNTVNMTGGVAGNIVGGYNVGDTVDNNTVNMNGGTVSGIIYGGRSFNGNINNNTVNMTGGTAGEIVGGYNYNGYVSGNTINMSGGTVNGIIYGGHSYTGYADNNTVTINSGTVNGIIYGGMSDSGGFVDGAANNNTVNINGGAINSSIYGGYSNNDTVSGNTVTMSDGTVSDRVTGGYSYNGNAEDNTVNMSGGTVSGSIYGGRSGDAGIPGNNTVNNTVNMSGGTANMLYGGQSQSGAVSGNTINMSGTAAVSSAVYGGQSQSGAVSGNTATINSGTVGNVYGGYSVDGAASNNTVAIDGGTVDGGEVAGGYSYSGNAFNNTVIINGGTINSNIHGGWSGNGNAAGNTVIINGGTINSYIYGGYSNSGALSNNTVTIYGGSFGRDVTLLGGAIGAPFSELSNNTLNLHTAISVAQVGSFANYNFYLPATVKNSDAMLTVLGHSSGGNEDTDITGSRISVDVAASAPILQKGDVIHLIKIQTPGYGLAGAPAAFNVQQGLSMLYEVESLQSDNAFSIRVLNSVLNPQSKAFSEGYAAGAAFVGQGADLLAGRGISAMRLAAAAGGWAAFGAAQGGKSSYSTGSSVDVTGMALMAGVATGSNFSAGGLLLGAFVEGGFGDYNSYNSFTNAAGVDGKGDTSYVGGGIMGRFGFNGGLYSEASLRLGHTETDFGAHGINNSYATYDSSGMYWGGHLGLGYVFALSEQAGLDVYAKYLFTRVQGDTVRLNSGEEVAFDNVCSQRGRMGARLSYAIPQLTPYVGAAYDYEFDGDVSGRLRGLAIDEPSLRGGTGIFEIGFNWQPLDNSAWSFDLGLEGYVGTREGISGGFKINYEF